MAAGTSILNSRPRHRIPRPLGRTPRNASLRNDPKVERVDQAHGVAALYAEILTHIRNSTPAACLSPLGRLGSDHAPLNGRLEGVTDRKVIPTDLNQLRFREIGSVTIVDYHLNDGSIGFLSREKPRPPRLGPVDAEAAGARANPRQRLGFVLGCQGAAD